MPICTLDHARPDGSAQITFDPATGLYALHLTRAGGWPPAPVFTIRFEGAAPSIISTDRHRVEGDRLTVTDTGFGNVLAGLASGETAVAVLGSATLSLDLTDAPEAVDAFRACPAGGLA